MTFTTEWYHKNNRTKMLGIPHRMWPSIIRLEWSAPSLTGTDQTSWVTFSITVLYLLHTSGSGHTQIEFCIHLHMRSMCPHPCIAFLVNSSGESNRCELIPEPGPNHHFHGDNIFTEQGHPKLHYHFHSSWLQLISECHFESISL